MNENKNCDKLEVRDSFKGKKCSEEQILNCHGRKKLEQMKKTGEI
ncbi:MAG: hypothetical protein ACXAEU_15705 [Candidatus Hodarchaeales archaeon]